MTIILIVEKCFSVTVIVIAGWIDTLLIQGEIYLFSSFAYSTRKQSEQNRLANNQVDIKVNMSSKTTC